MNKYQEAISNYFTAKLNFDNEMYKAMDLLEELVDKATPMKPIQLEEGKYSCPSCAMAFKLKTSINNMFVNNQYCDVCGQALDWSEDE